MKTSRVTAIATFGFFFFSLHNSVEVDAKPGFVVAKKPEDLDDIARFENLVEAYEKYNKTIDYKSQDEWDTMTTYDFEQYDAVVVVGNKGDCPSSDPSLSYNPFSNSLEWGSAIRHGNVIILATQELELPEFMDKESTLVIDAAVAFSLYNPSETGAIISLGPTYHNCDGLSAEWLNRAFGLTSYDDKLFNIVKNYSGRNFNAVVGKHPALQNLKTEVFRRSNGRASSLAMILSYPNGFVPFAVVTSYYNSPFILLWEGNRAPTGASTFVSTKSPTITRSPTINKMSSEPSSAVPSNSCKDKVSFFVNGDPTKTCDWIGQSVNRISKFCDKVYVMKNCPSTCDIECSIYPSQIPSSVPSRYNDTISPSSHKGSNAPSIAQSFGPSIQIALRTTRNPTIRPSDDRASSFHPSQYPSHEPSNLPSSRPSSSSKTSYTLVQQVANLMIPCKDTKSSKSRLCTQKLNKTWKSKSKSPKKSKKSRKIM